MTTYRVWLKSRPRLQHPDGYNTVSADSPEEAKRRAERDMQARFAGQSRHGWKAVRTEEIV